MPPYLTAAAFGALIAAIAPAAQAAEPLKMSGSVRARYELVEDQVRPVPLTAESAFNLRTILTAEYETGPLRFVGELWDSRVYGLETGTVISSNEINALEPVQAYVALALGGDQASLKVGRFTMDIGSRRLVANDDYRNTTNGFTGLRLDVGEPNRGIIAFYTAAQVRLPSDLASALDNQFELDRESGDLVFWGAAASRPTPWAKTSVDVAFLRLEEADAPGRPTRDRQLSTVSARVIRTPAPGRFDFDVEGAWQFGEISGGTQATAPHLDVTAGLLHLRGAYQFKDAWKTRVALEYEWVSGDDDDADFGRFDALFGSRRSDLAPSGIYNTVGRANILSPGLRLEVTPTRRLDAFLVARPMWLASRTDSFSTSSVRDATGASGDYAGSQLEGRLRYWLISGSLRFEAHGAYLNRGEFLKTAPNAGRAKADPKYLSLNLTWSF